MDRKEIINRLECLEAITEEARKYQTGTVNEWVGLGLLTEAEYAEFRQGWDAESYAHKWGKEAEEAIPWPNILDNPDLPKAYREIVERMAELKPLVDADEKVNGILRNARTSSWNRSRPYWGEEVGRLAAQVIDLLNTAEDPEDYRGEYRDLDAKKDPKERDGTVVRRLRGTMYDETERARKKARVEAYETALKHTWGDRGKTVGQVIARKKELDTLVEERQDAKRLQAAAQMERVLKSILIRSRKS